MKVEDMKKLLILTILLVGCSSPQYKLYKKEYTSTKSITGEVYNEEYKLEYKQIIEKPIPNVFTIYVDKMTYENCDLPKESKEKE